MKLTQAQTEELATASISLSYFINVSHKRIFAVLIVHKQTVRPSDDTQRQSLAPVSGAKLTRNYPWTVTITHRGNLPGLSRFPHKKNNLHKLCVIQAFIAGVPKLLTAQPHRGDRL